MKKYLTVFLFTVTLGLSSGIWSGFANASVYTCPATGVFEGAILLPDNKTLWCLYRDNNSPELKKFEHAVTIKHPWDVLSKKGGGSCMLEQDAPTSPLDCPVIVNVNASPIPK